MAKKNNNKKRKFEHDSSSELYNHRARNRPTEEARIDPTYGQRSAIPGLDGGDNGYYDEDGADLNYDDDMDALSYLRSVRQEATTIPNLLVAPKQDTTAEGEYDRSIYEDGVGDYRGWYEDGAFIAGPEAPVDASSNIDNGEAGKDPQLAYFDSVVTRFKTLRHQLRQTPPNEIIANLGTDHPIYLPTNSKKEVFAKWGYTMKNSDPVPAQLACMDKGTVFRLLTMLTRGTMLKRGCQVGSCLSRWIWGLLARVPDFGELNNVEISAVRELGKKAVLVGVGFKEAQEWGDGMDEVEAGFEGAEEDDLEPELVIDENIQLEDDEEDDIPADILLETAVESSPAQVLEDAIFDNGEFQNDIKDGDTEDSRIIGPEEDFEAAKARMLAQLNEQTQEEEVVTTELEAQLEKANGALPTLNTRATLDMIITVAGELYGQRDLLEFREIWGEE